MPQDWFRIWLELLVRNFFIGGLQLTRSKRARKCRCICPVHAVLVHLYLFPSTILLPRVRCHVSAMETCNEVLSHTPAARPRKNTAARPQPGARSPGTPFQGSNPFSFHFFILSDFEIAAEDAEHTSCAGTFFCVLTKTKGSSSLES